MKKKVHMICILKSGVVVKETLKLDKKNTRAVNALHEMKAALEDNVGHTKLELQNITFGRTTVAVSEIAAIKLY